jgi:hypothetical protein
MNQVEEHLSTADFVAGAGQTATREEARPPEEPAGSLLPAERVQEFRARWDQVQTGFVDEPRKAVEQADDLVATCMKQLAENFANERSRLEQQWDRGDQVNTEDLRQALRKYRAFFHRLLSV